MSHAPTRRPFALPALLASAAAAALVACSETLVCTSELRVALTPRDTTLAVAESVAPSLRLASCGGRERLAARFALTSADTAIVTVDPVTRRIVARQPGIVGVTVTDSTYGFIGTINVTVIPAP